MAHELGERIVATLERHPARQAHLAELLWIPLDRVSSRPEQEGRVVHLADGRWDASSSLSLWEKVRVRA